MDIISIGVDLVEIARIEKAVKTRGAFLTRIYDEQEIRLSERGRIRYEELAGRFAAKEAALKALKIGWREGVKFRDIIVLNERSGAPYLLLKDKAQTCAEAQGVKHMFVSISHSRELALAVVLFAA